MAGPPTALRQMADRLTEDPSLTAILTGGIHDREIARRGPHATPDAFDATGAQAPRPALVLIDGGEVEDVRIRAAVTGYVDLWFYAAGDAAGMGRTAIAEAFDRTKGLLYGWRFSSGEGPGAVIDDVGQRLGIRDDPVEAGRIFDHATVRYSGLWRNLG